MINKYQRMAFKIVRGLERGIWEDYELWDQETKEYWGTGYSGEVEYIAKILKDEFGKGNKELEIKRGQEVVP